MRLRLRLEFLPPWPNPELLKLLELFFEALLAGLPKGLRVEKLKNLRSFELELARPEGLFAVLLFSELPCKDEREEQEGHH